MEQYENETFDLMTEKIKKFWTEIFDKVKFETNFQGRCVEISARFPESDSLDPRDILKEASKVAKIFRYDWEYFKKFGEFSQYIAYGTGYDMVEGFGWLEELVYFEDEEVILADIIEKESWKNVKEKILESILKYEGEEDFDKKEFWKNCLI